MVKVFTKVLAIKSERALTKEVFNIFKVAKGLIFEFIARKATRFKEEIQVTGNYIHQSSTASSIIKGKRFFGFNKGLIFEFIAKKATRFKEEKISFSSSRRKVVTSTNFTREEAGFSYMFFRKFIYDIFSYDKSQDRADFYFFY